MSDGDLALSLAAEIRRLRQARGWSLSTLAEESGLHRTSLGLLERGERRLTIDSAERLANAFGIPLWQLIKDAGSS